MTHPGLGVMLRQLAGNADSAAVFQAAMGKSIAALSLADDSLQFEFDDGSKMRLVDNGQSCCESRYMRTDDDIASFVGSVLIDAEIADAPDVGGEDEYGCHEVQFLRVNTSKGTLVMSSHNEHNGYYGGFSIEAERC